MEQRRTIESEKSAGSLGGYFTRLKDVLSETAIVEERFLGRTSALQNRMLTKLIEKLEKTTKQEFITKTRSGSIPDAYTSVLNILTQRGLVKKAWLNNTRHNDAPSMYSCCIETSFPDGFTDGVVPSVTPHAEGTEREQTVSRAIGEFVERCSLLEYHNKDLIVGSVNTLIKKYGEKRVLSLELLAGFSNEQKKLRPNYRWNNDSVFQWEWATRFTSGKSVLMPAQLFHWNYKRIPSEPQLRQYTTNGSASMFSENGAILAGIYELVQRDGLMVFWLNGLVPPKVNPETVKDESFQKLYQKSIRYGFRVHCLNITSDIGIPTFAVVVEDSVKRWPFRFIGMDAHSHTNRALYRALEEAWGFYETIRESEPHSIPQEYNPLSDFSIDLWKRARIFANPEESKHYDFFLSGEERPLADFNFDPPPSLEEALDMVVKKIESLGEGYEVYFHKAHSKFFSDLSIATVHVVIPALVPLHLNEPFAHLGSKRLHTFPHSIGATPAKNFNLIPQPLA